MARARRSLVWLALALGAPVLVLAPLGAWADDAKPAKGASKPAAAKGAASASPDRYDPDNVAAISQYMETVVKAIEKYGAKDYTGAVDLLKKATQLNPRSPLASYVLGETYLAMENLPEAEAAFLAAQEVSDSKNPALRSKVLFAVADVYERQKKHEQAKAAWQAYAQHAAKLGDAGGVYPQTGAERLKALERVIELEKTYAAVRERIAAEKDGGADKGKAAPKK